LLDPHVVQDMLGEGAQLLGRLDEPLQHGIWIDLEHPCGAADAQSLGQARHDAHDEIDRGALPMKNRAQGLQKIAATGNAKEWAPGTATRMAIGAEIPPAHPAALAQFLAVCSRPKWSRYLTKSPLLALLATAGSNAAYKIISACSNAVS